jgi:hypothetical protein
MDKMRETLRQLMDKAGDNPYAVQRKSGVPQTTTHRFLKGTYKNAATETVRKWARAYGVTESQLHGFEPIDGIDVPEEPKELKDILPPEEYKLLSQIKKMDPKARGAVFELFDILANKPGSESGSGSSSPPVTERRIRVVSAKNQHLRAGEMHYSPPRQNRIKESHVATRQTGT